MRQAFTFFLFSGLLLAQRVPLAPFGANGLVAPTTPTGMYLQAATDKLGLKFYSKSTAPIDYCDIYFTVTGSGSGVTQKCQIEADGTNAPNDASVLGSASEAFAMTAGWSGPQSLAADTGALTLGAPYWLVIIDGGGTPPSGSYYPTARTCTNGSGGGAIRRYTTSWGAGTGGDPVFILHHTDGTLEGLPYSGALTSSLSLYGTAAAGIRFQVGAQATLQSITVRTSITGTPDGAFDVDLMVGGSATPVATISIPLASVVNNITTTFPLPAPQTLTAGTPYYLVAHQHSGGTNAKCYGLQSVPINATYAAATGMGTAFSYVSGTVGDPANLTVSNTYMPILAPNIWSIAADLTGTGGVCAACRRLLQ
jgi:hypothetical protein